MISFDEKILVFLAVFSGGMWILYTAWGARKQREPQISSDTHVPTVNHLLLTESVLSKNEAVEWLDAFLVEQQSNTR